MDDTWSYRRANIGFLGHVDSGKSTLVGRLLRHFHPFGDSIDAMLATQSEEYGKGSFRYAWWCDRTRAERERGISIQWNAHGLLVPPTGGGSRTGADLTLIDTPGHRDFITNMISPLAHVSQMTD